MKKSIWVGTAGAIVVLAGVFLSGLRPVEQENPAVPSAVPSRALAGDPAGVRTSGLVSDAPPPEAPAPPEGMPAPLAEPQQRPVAADLSKIPANEQASFQAALHQAFYAVEALTEEERAGREELREVSHFASNRAQDLGFNFLKDGGLRVQSGQPGKTWQGTLRVAGTGGGTGPASSGMSGGVPSNGHVWQAAGTRAERPASGVTEWYENRTEGMEHGFTLTERPADAGETGFHLDVALEGLEVTTDPAPEHAGNLIFTDPAGGQPVLGYRKLKVWDATGKELAALMQPSGAGVRFAVMDEGAVYPVTIDPLIVSLEKVLGRLTNQKITPLDRAAYDFFGQSVAISGDYALVGAPAYDGVNMNTGAAYVFARVGTTWTQQAKLTASDAGGGDDFGHAVAISGNYALIGSPENDDAGAESGAAYVFARVGSTWAEQAKLTADDADAGDGFGWSVAVSSDYAIVGAPQHEEAGIGWGSVYVFVRTGTTWTRQTELKDAEGRGFGYSVAMSGVDVVVGSPFSFNSASNNFSGVAYLFTRSGGAWVQQTRINIAYAAEMDAIGWSVAISGDYALIGTNINYNGELNSGAAYVFVRTGTTWTQQAYLTAADARVSDFFGSSVAISGDHALIGAYGNNGTYFFVRSGSTWIQEAKFTTAEGTASSVAVSGRIGLVGTTTGAGEGLNAGLANIYPSLERSINSQPGDASGLAVDVDGDAAIAGALDHDLPGAAGGGAVWTFDRSGTTWIPGQKLTDNNPAAGDRFGVAVAVHGHRVVVGADSDDELNILGAVKTNCGSASVFERNTAGNWVRLVKFSSDAAAGDQFGRSVAISQNTIVVGAPGAFSGGGRAWTYTNGSPFFGQALSPAGAQAGAMFGFSVAVSGPRIIVGAPRTDTPSLFGGSSIIDTGRIHYFKPDSFLGFWQNDGSNAPLQAHSCAGFSVAMDGNTAVVGSSGPAGWAGADSAGASGRAGRAFVVTHNGTDWSPGFTYLDATGLPAGSWFGMSVAVEGDVAAVGAFGNNTVEGKVRLFRREGTGWVKQADVAAPAPDNLSSNAFGVSTALSGDTLLVGAYGVNAQAGASYVYRIADPSAVPPQLLASPPGPDGNLTLAWPAGTGLALWKSPSLAPGSWTKIPGSESVTTYSAAISAAPHMFFRLAPP